MDGCLSCCFLVLVFGNLNFFKFQKNGCVFKVAFLDKRRGEKILGNIWFESSSSKVALVIKKPKLTLSR